MFRLSAILLVAVCAFLTVNSHANTDEVLPASSEPPEFTCTVLETGPTVQTPKSAINEPEAASVIAPATSQPIGALTGRIVFTHGGHGWTYNNANGSGWYTQRGVTEEMNEDYGNLDQMTMFAFYCFNAGATVVPLRPVGHQTNEVVLDNDSANVSYAGAWSNSSGSLFYGQVGDVPYRFAAVAASETATATYTPNIPVTGFYPVTPGLRMERIAITSSTKSITRADNRRFAFRTTWWAMAGFILAAIISTRDQI